MKEQKNPLNAYNQFEVIRLAVDQLETIHVYELNARQYGDADTPSLKNNLAELDKQILEYEVELANLQATIDNLQASNKALLDANNKLIAEKNLISENHQSLEDEADKIIEAYKKLPRIVKKFYGVS